ncbi:hypothetical protein PF005_g327 [Phytophthora fragariae]|uniref:Retrovirus-related Pol polyprotein from transposon TNT 1-94 n=2 Tax=Phytophthora fragariae TaxID=53985 RepID=A0A6A4AHN7_9STRA|nr:hypothetical protein PF005_g327 [Phytophthora fragariae]KAE9257865.1 hypothetical protein PF002_g608 [Phytophthora fragariae]
MPKMKDLDWPGFPEFSGKEIYAGVGADFLAWGKKFVQRLVAAQLMSGGDWPDDFTILALNNKLEGPALDFFDKMLPKWVAESNTVEHVMDRMLGFYSTKVPVSKAMGLMSEAKPSNKTWTEHFQYLVYVAERAGCPVQFVLQCLCDSAPEHVKRAMLTRLDSSRVDYIQHAWELVAFAAEYEISSGKTHARSGVSRSGRGGFGDQGGHGGQGGRGQGFVGRVDAGGDRACWGCGKEGHMKRDCPGEKTPTGGEVTLAVSSACTTRGLADDGVWILDSGSSVHLVNDESLLRYTVDYVGSWSTTNGGMFSVTKRGTVELRTVVDGSESRIDLTNVYYSKGVINNIISYGLLEEKGVYLTRLNRKSYVMRESDERRIFEVRRANGVLLGDTLGGCGKQERVNAVLAAVESRGISADAVTECTLLELHNRLGHFAFDTLECMADAPGSGVKLTSRVRLNCLTCPQRKQHKVNQSKKDTGQNSPVAKIGGVICSDIKGPMTPRDRHGNRYMINFVDHSSNYVRAFLAKNKVEATKKFEHFLVFFEKEYSCRIHVLRTDGGGEYMNVEDFCRATGVRRQVSEANNQASNGKAKRMHRTILNMARCMLFVSGLPLKFWGYAVEYAAYVLNRSACSANPRRMSPIEVLTGKCPDMAGIVTFGSPCTVYRDPGKRAWQPRAEVGMIVGKNDETKGFKVYIPKDMVVVTTQHIGNVETLDSKQNIQLQAQLKREDPELWRSIEEREDATQQKEKAPKKKKKQSKGKKKKKKAHGTNDVGGDTEGAQGSEGAWEQLAPTAASAAPAARMQTRHMGVKHVPVQVVHAVVTPDPRNYREAMRDARANKWKEAIKVEFEALESNNTWEVVARPRNSKLLHTKWVFKTKTHADGTVEPVLDMTIGKLIFVMAHVWGVPVRHGDVPSPYVKADKEEGLEIYLYIPDGMEIPDELLALLGVKHKGQLALRLIKSMYGLKQAGRLWSRLLHKILAKLGFCQCYMDGCLYYKRDAGGVTLVGVYVDDLLVTGTSSARVDAFFEDMAVLELKDLGVVSKFLGIGFEYDKDKGWLLEQRQVILGMLDKFGLSEASAVRVPIGGEHENDVDGELLPNDGAGSSQRPTVQTFQSLVGSLLWIARCTRPYIAYAVHRVTRRTHEPRVSDWRLAKKIARYLKGTVDTKVQRLRLRRHRVDRKSVSGGVLMVCGMVVGWICKKQSSVALSTMEAEFVAASEVTAGMLGIVELLSEIGIKVKVSYKLHVDN